MQENNRKKILLVSPRGFCAGVSRAIQIVELVLAKFENENVYVLHEVVHNKHVVEELNRHGAIFVDCLDEIPDGAITVFSAHGVSKEVEQKAVRKNLRVYDATCPIVDKVHRKVRRISDQDEEIIMIGHAKHQEVEGTVGQYTSRVGAMHVINNIDEIKKINIMHPDRLHFVTQTTLSVDEAKNCIDALKQAFPLISGPATNDICYATQNRQQAVKEVAKIADVVLVVGSKNSSNSNRLSEVARQTGCVSYLIDDYTDLTPEMTAGKNIIAITSGASAPEYLIEEIVKCLNKNADYDVENIGVSNEKQNFKLPSGL
ncbi:MAG: 4-hydroxy-3-methylbut-2-enyl diphosphate reductase [Ruminobacter sp.]|uniref:4-hydroxy-3-methylbut-2-enyl diphosphate reductase n=1 Tax=unclassified Ruminobacter TaxID=2627913 RepID=UPI0004E1610B|nr:MULTISPECIES: 4-hydroxy-3-methylbut-2-enyl diphosphate reductase [unclassified Ruminobacter]MBQ3774755.1 4-hydroxy-3-methylbut-2-enyl diphosphate reductase [Ruminobacter sp.]